MSHALTPEDIALLREPSDPRINPLGNDVLVSLRAFHHQRRTQDIFWVQDGDEPRQITENGQSHHPAWSPDGRLFCYAEGLLEDGSSRLHVLNRNLQTIYTAVIAGDVESAEWSPDGTHIAVEYLESMLHGGDPRIRVVDQLRHHFDSRSYIGTQQWRIALLDTSSGILKDIGDGTHHHFSPAWSPDGSQLAMVTTRRVDWDLEWVWDIFVLSLDSGEWQQVTDSSGIALHPAWSPDGSHLAFLHNHSRTTGSTSDYHLFESSRESADWTSRCLTHALDRGAAAVHEPPEPGGGKPCYTPDGDHIVWVINDRGIHRLARTQRDGETVYIKDHVGWPSRTTDGRQWAALAYHPDSPARVVRWDDATGALEVEWDANPWLQERQLCRSPQLFSFNSSHHRVEAWLWQTSPEQPKPLLVQFHGGPHGAFGPYFSVTQQILASHGYLVAALNYRGSASYGQAFADLVHANWGPFEGEDGLRLIQSLAGEGLADAERVGVFGPSYGGFMTNWMVTHYPHAVHAGVAISTVSSLLTSALGIDHWESLGGDQGGLPWEIPGYYHDHSPVMFADRVQAPLLLLHGEEDMTCPLIEAEMMFSALRIQRKPVQLVRYVGESHSFHRAGSLFAMVDAHQRMLAWFKKI